MARFKPPGLRKKTRWVVKPGAHGYAEIELLIKLTCIRSKPLIRAIESYLVQGTGIPETAKMYKVTISNLNRGLRLVNTTARTVKRYNKECVEHANQTA